MRNSNRIEMVPMVAALVPFIVGILCAHAFEVPTLAWCILLLPALVAAVAWRRAAEAMLALALLALGAILYNINTPPQVIYDTPQRVVVRFDENPTTAAPAPTSRFAPASKAKTASSAASATAPAPRKKCTARIVEADGMGRGVRGARLVVWCDEGLEFSVGDEAEVVAPIRRLRTTDSRYGEMLHLQGCVGNITIRKANLHKLRPASRKSLHTLASEKLRRLLPKDDRRATILAMTTAMRDEVSVGLRQGYSHSGTSHLLAVSGLHVGIVFVLVNALLYLLPLVRRGNILKSLVGCLVIWIYVAVCAAPPSAVRAAAMFSALQFALIFGREYVGINILAATAFFMLAITPQLLFDVGFQLSFIAVTAILVWGVPVCRRVRTRLRIVNILISTIVVGFVSSIATMPIVSHTFGIIAIAGIVLNPAVILLANIIVLSAVAALISPLCIARFAILPALYCARLQNAMVACTAALPYTHFEYRLGTAATLAIYAVFILLSLVVTQRISASPSGKANRKNDKR